MNQGDGDVLGTNEFNNSWLNGRLKYEYINPNVSKARVIGYHLNGKLSFEYFLKEDKLDGLCMAWYENGQLRIEEVFTAGRLLVSKEWFASGQIKSETPYKKGKIHGIYKSWYETGQLSLQCPYREHLRHGVATSWYPNGKVKSREKFENGLPHGVNTYCDEDGKQLTKKVFIRGTCITNKIHDLINSGGLAARHILKINNTEVRRVCLEELGYSRFLAQLEHEVIDKKEDYELVKISWHKREEPIGLVKVKCPSTGAFYTLRVPLRIKTVKEAVAWTFGMPGKEYQLGEES